MARPLVIGVLVLVAAAIAFLVISTRGARRAAPEAARLPGPAAQADFDSIADVDSSRGSESIPPLVSRPPTPQPVAPPRSESRSDSPSVVSMTATAPSVLTELLGVELPLRFRGRLVRRVDRPQEVELTIDSDLDGILTGSLVLLDSAARLSVTGEALRRIEGDIDEAKWRRVNAPATGRAGAVFVRLLALPAGGAGTAGGEAAFEGGRLLGILEAGGLFSGEWYPPGYEWPFADLELQRVPPASEER